MPDLDLAKLREIAEKAKPDDWEDEFWDSFPPAVILQLLDEIDRLQTRENASLGGRIRALNMEIDRLKDYLREKNEIIKAFAGPTGMTPEDVAYALTTLRSRIEELEKPRNSQQFHDDPERCMNGTLYCSVGSNHLESQCTGGAYR